MDFLFENKTLTFSNIFRIIIFLIISFFEYIILLLIPDFDIETKSYISLYNIGKDNESFFYNSIENYKLLHFLQSFILFLSSLLIILKLVKKYIYIRKFLYLYILIYFVFFVYIFFSEYIMALK